jgi:cobalamin biosynthesis Mg chelatase CobN
MDNPTVSDQTPVVTPGGYSPSVPITLYREITAELQNSKSTINSLQAQNQELLQQNQQLRRELNNVIQATVKLQTAINSAQKLNLTEGSLSAIAANVSQHSGEQSIKVPKILSAPSSVKLESIPQPPQRTQEGVSVSLPNTKQAISPEMSEKLFTEKTEGYLRSSSDSQRPELNGWWLIVSILLIVFAAFGAGYWIVRPILQQR